MGEDFTEEKKQYYCSECGNEVSASDLVCPVCGADLSEFVGETPEDLVTLQECNSQQPAEQLISLLGTYRIKAFISDSSSSKDKNITEVVVARADLEAAKSILKEHGYNTGIMYFSDIFSSSFTIAGKQFKTNIKLAVLFIPAIIVFLFCLYSFTSSIYIPKSRSEKALVISYTIFPEMFKYPLEPADIRDRNTVMVKLSRRAKNSIHINDTVTVTVNSPGNTEYNGYISGIDNNEVAEVSGEDTIRFYHGYVKVTEADSDFTRSKISSIDIVYRGAVSIFEEAIHYKDDKTFVYIANNGKAKAVEVKTSLRSRAFIKVDSGLSYNDTVIYQYDSPGQKLEEGIEITTDYSSPEIMIKNAVWNYFLLFFGSFLVIITFTAIRYEIIKNTSDFFEGKEISVRNTFSNVFSNAFLRALLIEAIRLFVIWGPFFSLIFIKEIISHYNYNLFTTVSLLVPVSFLAGMHFFVKWRFPFVHSAISGDSLFQSIRKSTFLVKNLWWWTFGILFVAGLAVNLIITIISTPVSFIFLWDYISLRTESTPERLYTALIWGFGLTILFSYILKCFIEPVFSVIMYYDLRIRKNDFFVNKKESGSNNNPLIIV